MAVQLGSRVREMKPIPMVDPQLIVGSQSVGVVGGGPPSNTTFRVNSYGTPQLDYKYLAKCWDELHHREQVVKYYIKRKCHRRVYLSQEEADAYKALCRAKGLTFYPDLYSVLAPGKYYTSGGPFTLIRVSRLDEYTVKYTQKIRRYSSGVYFATYTGGFLPTEFGTFCPSRTDLYNGHLTKIANPGALQDGLEQLGAKAWNKARPKTQSSDILTFLGELRETPEMLKTSAKGFYDVYRSLGGKKTDLLMPNKLASHFLNHNFGWVPFVGDLVNFYDTYQHLDQRIKQMLRDNGQWIKRTVRVEEDTQLLGQYTDTRTTPQVYPTLHDWLYKKVNGKYGETRYLHEKYHTTWFSGRFKYYIPRPPDNPDNASYNRVLDVLRQYGVRISPAVVWNLIPYSWLADWFGNVGDIISNVDAQNNDNLVAKYAYIMRHSRERYVNDSSIYTVNGEERLTWARELESKVRIEATPFGFGLTGGGINSNYRMAILGALGLTRSRVAR